MSTVVFLGDLGWRDELRLPERLPWSPETPVIANLEGPVCERPTGKGPSTSPDVLRQLVAWGVTHVSLANNHTHDLGLSGLDDTLASIASLPLVPFGLNGYNGCTQHVDIQVGESLLRVLGAGWRVIGCRTGRGGSAVPELCSIMPELERASSFTVAFPHWGYELDPHPQPAHLDLADGFLDAGGLAVIGNHAHVPGAAEYRHGGYVAYNLGDWAFSRRTRARRLPEDFALAVELDIPPGRLRLHRFERLTEGVGELLGSHTVSIEAPWWSPGNTGRYPPNADDYALLRRSGQLPQPRRGLPLFMPDDGQVKVTAKSTAVAVRNVLALGARRVIRLQTMRKVD